MWIEDPGFPLIRPIVTRHDVEILPVPVDDNGLDITSGIQNYPDARFALITPAHQSPLGVALSLARRHQILEWAIVVRHGLLKMIMTVSFAITVSRYRR